MPEPTVARQAPQPAAATDLSRAVNDAGFRIFHAALREGENTTVSPVSIGVAFGVADAGASGQAAQAIDDFFGFPGAGEERWGAFNSLDQLVTKDASAFDPPAENQPGHATVTLANRLFIDEAFDPLPAYADVTARFFGAATQREPLATDGEASAKHVNEWVKERTNGLIPTLVTKDFFTPDSRLTLVNTVYMKADWEVPFDPEWTVNAPFALLDGSTADVDLMNASGRYGRVVEGDDFVSVALPYAFNELEMILIVPDQGAFQGVEQGLDQEWLDSFDAGATQREFNLTMPKFTTEGSLDLREALEAAGGTGIFDAPGFDGIGPDLSLSSAIHATKVIVDEKGTEAAAATALGMVGTAMPSDPPVEIRADKPFLYVIRDVQTGAALFVGRVLDPR